MMGMDALTLCLLIPLVTAVLCIFPRDSVGLQKLLGVGGAAAWLLSACWLYAEVNARGVVVVRMGGWPAPYGIAMVADLFAAIMVLVSAVIALAAAIYSVAEIDERRLKFGYFSFFHFMLLGVGGAFLTGDIFNLFVWFEVMLIASFVLMTLGGKRAEMEGAVKYVTLNLLASTFFLAGCGILYAKLGTLNMADLAQRIDSLADPGQMTVTGLIFLAAFGVKAAIFPLFFWLPASYHTPPVAVSAVFAGLLTKVGFYALVRVFTLIFDRDLEFTHGLLLVLGSITMVVGVLGAAVQFEVRRLLSFHIVSQIGYMVVGLALFTQSALAGMIYFLLHNIIAKSNLYLLSGLMERYGGSFQLKKLGGLLAASPLLGVLFFIPAMSLGGVPPLSGFFAKFAIVKAALASDSVFAAWAGGVAALALAVGLMTLFSMTKIWAEAFWKAPATKPDVERVPLETRFVLLCPIVLLAGLTVAMGLTAGPMLEAAGRAATQLLDSSEYLKAVLGQ